jgi:hypothetical protein
MVDVAARRMQRGRSDLDAGVDARVAVHPHQFGAGAAATQAVVSAVPVRFCSRHPLYRPAVRSLRPTSGFTIRLLAFVGSLLAAVSPSLESVDLRAYRTGAAAARASATVSRAVLGDVYRDWRLARALAALTLFMMMGT